jgi:hypothetical protein
MVFLRAYPRRKNPRIARIKKEKIKRAKGKSSDFFAGSGDRIHVAGLLPMIPRQA